MLLALTDAWEKSPAYPFLGERGIQAAALAERAISLTEREQREPRASPATVAQQQIHAAQVARVLGISRARVAELTASTDFPRSQLGPLGQRRWRRRDIALWAAKHPEGDRCARPEVPLAQEHCRLSSTRYSDWLRRSLRSFLRYYNRRRPHSSLGDRPPISAFPTSVGRTASETTSETPVG